MPVARLGLHPLRSILWSFWLIYIAILIWLLEWAVRDGHQNPNPPWHLHTLPQLLLTFFAQAHAAITATHLARLSASFLFDRGGPRTWQEMFWLTDRAWSGPIGILVTLKETIRLRLRISFTFFLFSITCLVAIVTPSILTRAYPIENVIVNVIERAVRPRTFDPQAAVFDSYLQEGGMGGWYSGLAAVTLYNNSIFTPSSDEGVGMEAVGRTASSNVEPQDVFVAGDVGNANVTLPGLRLSGGCSIDSNRTGLVFPTNISDTTSAYQFCQQALGTAGTADSVAISSSGLSVNLWLCASLPYSSLHNQTQDDGYVYYSYSDTSSGANGQGLIHCQVSFSTGYANLHGISKTFQSSSFQATDLLRADLSRGGEPPSEPMVAAWTVLSQASQSRTVQLWTISGLSFQPQSDGIGIHYDDVEGEVLANRLWSSIAHVTANMAILSWSDDQVYSASIPVNAAVHVRVYPFAGIAYALLGFWLLLMVIIPLYTFKRTFVDHLDSYTASLLVLRHGQELLAHAPLGDSADNERLRETFDVVVGKGE